MSWRRFPVFALPILRIFNAEIGHWFLGQTMRSCKGASSPAGRSSRRPAGRAGLVPNVTVAPIWLSRFDRWTARRARERQRTQRILARMANGDDTPSMPPEPVSDFTSTTSGHASAGRTGRLGGNISRGSVQANLPAWRCRLMAHRCPGSARRHVRKWRKLTLRRNLFSQPRVGEMRASLLHVAFADEFT
jgi:hypothetical protein